MEAQAKHDHVLGNGGSFVCGSNVMSCLYRALWSSGVRTETFASPTTSVNKGKYAPPQSRTEPAKSGYPRTSGSRPGKSLASALAMVVEWNRKWPARWEPGQAQEDGRLVGTLPFLEREPSSYHLG
ncbi:hypothetical protein mRhiFer1_009871 [Rhinolophus ferrumequinum]|uniref:Uncharacterized protein n=1 Tax=Rhinolophus ferrumequinum TaxID=59479 RepID=A0A7J7YRU3_RHIFE|nr:hypothetical protein mRhiFer1_009871 [Rhinolophus ferrumequinum]